MRRWRTELVLLALGALLLVAPLRGQDPPEEPRGVADQKATGGSVQNRLVQEVTPRGMYLRNERGDLVYVPDVSYEQFEQLLLQQRDLATPERPALTIKDMAVSGQVRENQVEARVDFTLECIARGNGADSQWVSVPLRFGNAYLRREPVFQGPGQHFLTFDEAQNGYVCWVQMAGEATVHQVGLELLIPVNQVGEERDFALQAPSPLASTLTLTVPESPAEGTIEDQGVATKRVLTFVPDADGSGVFTARGLRGDVTINWHKSRAAEQRADARLDVFGTIVVTADELLQEVRSDGRFVVRGFGGPTEVFQVRLPPGMRLRELPEPGYAVRLLPETADITHEGQLVEVRLERPTSGEIPIRLVAELPAAEDDPSWPLTVSRLVDSAQQFQPARFVFVGAARHRGQIDLIVKGDWSLFWADDAGTPRSPSTGPTAANDRPAARFRYFDQQDSLRVWIRPQPARVTVEPTYDVYLDTQQAQLFASLVCRTSGSRAGNLKLSLPGWVAETATFADLDSSLPIDISGNALIIPIPVEAQASGRFNLQIEARQELPPAVIRGVAPLRIALPTVSAENPARTTTIVAPATVTMIPADNVRLTPRQQDLQALAPQIIPISAGDAATDADLASDLTQQYAQRVFRYRDRGASEQAVFVGDFKVQPQAISVTLESTVHIDRRSYGLEQTLSYRVLHEAVEELQLVFPAQFAENAQKRVRILLNDEPLTPLFAAPGSSGRIPVRVRLPEPKLGPVELRVIHPRQPLAELAADRPYKLVVPLVFAASGGQTNTTVIANSMTILHQDPLNADILGSTWTVTESESGPGRLVLTTAADNVDAVVELSLRSESLASSTILDQVWIQTWLTATQRSDRCVYRLRTPDAHVRVRLPQRKAGSIMAVEVAANDVRTDAVQEGGQLIVPTGNQLGEIRALVLEVWYRMERESPEGWPLSLEPALPDAVDGVERCYWQLILPRNEVVVWGNQAPYATLQWRRWAGWQRRSVWEQRDLEAWIGASHQEPIPSTFNTYLFTSFGEPRQLRVYAGSRPLILLSLSGGSLLVGLLLIYFPVLRHPATWVVLGVILASGALLAPELALLAAQAASLGIVLAVLARVLRALLQRGRDTTTTVQGRAQFSDSKVDARYPRGDGSSQAHTATASAVTHTPATESHS